MEIALLVALFLIGSVGGALQALKYVERRRHRPADAETDTPGHPTGRRR
jgi:hypothetical protein